MKKYAAAIRDIEADEINVIFFETSEYATEDKKIAAFKAYVKEAGIEKEDVIVELLEAIRKYEKGEEDIDMDQELDSIGICMDFKEIPNG